MMRRLVCIRRYDLVARLRVLSLSTRRLCGRIMISQLPLSYTFHLFHYKTILFLVTVML